MAPKPHQVLFNTEFPVIMAPMFLVSNTTMVLAALNSGISGAIPALNYRTDQALREAILEIKAKTNKPFGINLIVNRSNPKYLQQLKTCLELGVDYIITSLGNPEICIKEAHKKGIKVFCDVIDLTYALKVQELGADAVIAVNSAAGGHAGKLDQKSLLESLLPHLHIPIISAGGMATVEHVREALALGATAVSVGTVFIATNEAGVSDEYKEALVEYGAKDIVHTNKMSGSALTVINTPYVKSIGTEATWFEKMLLRNKVLKKYVKMLIALRGIKKIEHAANKATYKTVWVAGPSIEHVHAVRSVSEVAHDLTSEL